MRNAGKYTGLVLILLLVAGGVLTGQQQEADLPWSTSDGGIREEGYLFTDRSLYVTNEPIRFSARVFPRDPNGAIAWSSIFYVELISPAGETLVSGKFSLRAQKSEGSLNIPSNVRTGNYFLRGYTRWMRNAGPAYYCYVPLKIVNPESPELMPDSGNESAEERLVPVNARVGLVGISTQSEEIDRRDTLSFQISALLADESRTVSGCLSVVPAHISSPLYSLVTNQSNGSPKSVASRASRASQAPPVSTGPLNYLPDRNGFTLSGRLMESGNRNRPIPDGTIHLSLLGNQPDYFVKQSDSLGRFALTLPERKGTMELFIQPDPEIDGKSEVRINREYDPRHIPIQGDPFQLSGEERRVAEIFARNLQLAQIYQPDHLASEDRELRDPLVFYGTPSRRILMDDFVLLPTLEEVIMNLVPGVLVVYRKNRTTLLIQSDNPGISLFDPLILIDGVPFFNLARVMSVSPARIRQIDVVDEVYVKGDMRFGGIINLISREGDMAGIDLPDQGVFIDMEGTALSSRSDEHESSQSINHPDTRNTFLWDPDLILQSAEPATLSLEAPDYPGEYIILFRGFDEQGNYLEARSGFQIK